MSLGWLRSVLKVFDLLAQAGKLVFSFAISGAALAYSVRSALMLVVEESCCLVSGILA